MFYDNLLSVLAYVRVLFVPESCSLCTLKVVIQTGSFYSWKGDGPGLNFVFHGLEIEGGSSSFPQILLIS